MFWTCKSNAIDIINLKRPTGLDKIISNIPKPEGAIPNFGLPKWKVMPLESKIPMVPGPEGAYNFTRRKVGQKLWVDLPNAEFNLSDPYSYEMNLIYDPLHDKHLIPFFSRTSNIRHLLKAGLITDKLDAKCSLQDYNMYRKYLRKIYCDSIKQQLKRMARFSYEKRVLQYAEDQAQKEAKMLRKQEQLQKAHQKQQDIKMKEEKEKIQRQKDKEQKLKQKMKALELARDEERRLRKTKAKAQSKYIRQKLKIAADIERQKIIHTLLDWSKKERLWKKAREARFMQEQKEKHEVIKLRWELKQDLQRQQIEKEEFLLKCIDTQQKEFIKQYTEKIEKERERMNKLFERTKLFVKCYMARRLPRGRSLICCKLRYNEEVDKDEEIRKLSCPEKYFEATRKNIRTDKSIHWKKTPGIRLPIKQTVKAKQSLGKKIRKRKLKAKKLKTITETSQDKEKEEIIPEPKIVKKTESIPAVPKLKCRCKIIKTLR